MVRSRKARRRPATPNLKLSQEDYQHPHPHTADPTSPPETPTTSPPASRKISLKPRHQPDFSDLFQPLSSDPNIKPVGNGHQFSYQPTLRPEQLSPRSASSSSSSSSDAAGESTDEESSESASIANVPIAPEPAMLDAEDAEDGNDSDIELSDSDDSDDSDSSEVEETSHLTADTSAVPCNFILEDIDVMDSDCEGLDVLYPTEIESNRSRSRSRHKDLDSGMMHEFKNLNCSNETSDNEASPEGDYDYDEDAFRKRRELLKKYRRMSMGSSFGKRTHSELSDSDEDIEGLDVHEVGSSARRLRRKLHRTSLLFNDPPQARIDELEEPDSSEDEFAAGQDLARELPYWTMEIMEMDSSPGHT